MQRLLSKELLAECLLYFLSEAAMTYHQYFPPEILLLQEEITKHPDVQEALAKTESMYFEDRLAAICTHLGILVDGDFDVDEICALAEMITRKLYEKRTGIVTLSH